MIQPLRQLHGRVVATLAVVLPVLLLASLIARKPFPQTEPSWIEPTTFETELAEQIRPFKNLLAPDVLVYWTPEPAGRALPGQARLLGSLHGMQASTPSLLEDGVLLFYSLAHQRVVAQTSFHRKGEQP